MSSIRDKMIASIRGRSESPNPNNRGPRPESHQHPTQNTTHNQGPGPNQGPNQNQNPRPHQPPRSTTPSRSTTPTMTMRRLPSSDALSRSSHNATLPDDGSTQSKDQIISSLKKANAELTSKTAEMEATFMNQCNVLASEISAQNKIIESRDASNKMLRSKISSHETQLKEGIQIITALESEKTFQRQTITDLKNQLFQLQGDVEDSEYDKSEEVTLHKQRTQEAEKKAQELEKERSILIHKIDEACMERDTAKAELVQLKQDKEDGNNTSIEIAIQDTSTHHRDYSISSPASVASETTSEVRQNWRHLEEKKEQLENALQHLHETQSALATLDHKHKALQKQFDDTKNDTESETKQIKDDLQKVIDELKSTSRSKDETIANLHQRLESYNDDLTKAEDEVDRLNAEIEDKDLNSIKDDLEETKRLLENEKQHTADLMDKNDDLTSTVEQLEEETHELRINSVDQIIEDKEKQVESLEHEIDVFRRKLGEEKQQAEMLLNIKASRISQLENDLKKSKTAPEMRLNQLEDENQKLQDELEAIQEELHDTITNQNEIQHDMQKKLDERDVQMLLSYSSDEYEDLTKKFDMSTNSIGVVNDMVVTRLKSNLSELEEDHTALQEELNKQISIRDETIAKLQDEIDSQRKEVSTIEESHKDNISNLNKEIEKQNISAKKVKVLLDKKDKEIQRLEEDVVKHESTIRQKQFEEIEKEKESTDKVNALMKENENLKNSITNQKTIEMKQLEMRQDLESSEESWKEEKRQMVEELMSFEKQLNEALNETNSQREEFKLREVSLKAEKEQLLEEQKEFAKQIEAEKSTLLKKHIQETESLEGDWKAEKLQLVEEKEDFMKKLVQETESLEGDWKAEKLQLVEEKEDFMKKLDVALKESSLLKENIDDLESQTLEQEKMLTSFKNDLLLLDEVRTKLGEKQKELDEIKEQRLLDEKSNEQKAVGLKKEGMMKRGDKLKMIELNEEVEKLRSELRKVRGRDTDISGKVRQEAVKKAYSMAKDTKHKKELSDLEEKFSKEIDDLKNKLSDRDTTITATLRSSVLQDQKMNTMKDKLRELQDKHDFGADSFSLSSGRNAFEELENLRVSVQNHEETYKSLTQQIKSLKKQLSIAKMMSSTKVGHGSATHIERQLEEYKTRVRERDGAIQTLVKSSITQEQQITALRDEVNDLKNSSSSRSESKNYGESAWAEVDRLQQESEIFAGQIIEQDEEIEDLRILFEEAKVKAGQAESLRNMVDDLREQLDEQDEMRDEEKYSERNMSDGIKKELEEENARMKTRTDAMNMELREERRKREEENARMKTMTDAMNMELEEERRKRNELEFERQSLLTDGKQDMRLTKIHAELEEVEETNQKLHYEIRGLRRNLRSMENEAERADDLESELAETKKMLHEMKRTKYKSGGGDLREDLEEALEQRDELDSEARKLRKNLRKMEEECGRTEEACRKLEEVITVCREEKNKLLDEYIAKEIELNRALDDLRIELRDAVKAREEIEGKIKEYQDNEKMYQDNEKMYQGNEKMYQDNEKVYKSNDTRLKSQFESQKTLREIAISDKENVTSRAIQEAASYQERMSELQRDLDDQNDLIASLTDEVKNLRQRQIQMADTESTEIISALSAEVKKLRHENMSKESGGESLDIIAALSDEVKKLRNSHSQNDSDDVIAALSQEVKTLHAALNNEARGNNNITEMERVIRSEIEQEMLSIRSQKDFLGKENMKLQSKLEDLASDRKKISTFKKQIEEAEKGRTMFEKTMISTYERKLNLMQMNKDLTIDGLRKDLQQNRESLKEIESDLLKKVKSLEEEKIELEAELKAKMDHKNAKIQFLNQTLTAHEQVAGHMKNELDQLQNGMETVSVTRRAEVEELQEELMSAESRATKYDREITALKMKIEDQKAQHKNDMSTLRYRMEEMEIENDENPSIRQLAEKDKMAVHELSKQVDSLRVKVGSLQEENFDLREKVEKGRGDSRLSKNDKWRNSALQEQVQALTKRLREIEGDDASIRSSSSRKSIRLMNASSSGRRIAAPPRGMGYKRTNHGSVGGDDISTHTEETF